MGLGPPFLREIIPFALGDWARTGQYINGVLYHGNLNGCHKVFGEKKEPVVFSEDDHDISLFK